jgi:tetratricopeptide (TPR) repeat protein
MVAVTPIGRHSPPYTINPPQPFLVSDRQQPHAATGAHTPFLRAVRHGIPNKQYNRHVDSFAPTPSTEELHSKGSNTSIGYGISSSSTTVTDCVDETSESNVGSALIDSGLHHYFRGEHEKALKAFSVALKTQRISLEESDHISIAHTLGNIGAVYLKQNKLDEAFEVLREALYMKMRLIIAAQSLLPSSESKQQPRILLADTLNNMGNIAYMKGNYEDSMRYYRRALRELREYSPTIQARNDLVDCLQNIGRVHLKQMEWEAALTIVEESNKVTREVHGDRHILTVSSLKLIGYIHLAQSRLDEATKAFTEAQSIIVRELGPNHVDNAAAWYNIGMVREAEGKLKDAWEAYNLARAIYFQNGLKQQADHVGVRNVRRSIALVEQMVIKAKRNRQRPVSTEEDVGKTTETLNQPL